MSFSCEKKIVVPVQLCVLSTGFVNLMPQTSAVCTTFPSLFPHQIKVSDTIENCGIVEDESDEGCECGSHHGCNSCDPCEVEDDSDDCGIVCEPCAPPPRPHPRQSRPQGRR